jgi:hypothetical protein
MDRIKSKYSTAHTLPSQYPHQTASGRREQLANNNRISPPYLASKGSIDVAIAITTDEPTLDDSQLGSGNLHTLQPSEDIHFRHVPLPYYQPQPPVASARPSRGTDSPYVNSRISSRSPSGLDFFHSEHAKSSTRSTPDLAQATKRHNIRIPARTRCAWPLMQSLLLRLANKFLVVSAGTAASTRSLATESPLPSPSSQLLLHLSPRRQRG